MTSSSSFNDTLSTPMEQLVALPQPVLVSPWNCFVMSRTRNSSTFCSRNFHELCPHFTYSNTEFKFVKIQWLVVCICTWIRTRLMGLFQLLDKMVPGRDSSSSSSAAAAAGAISTPCCSSRYSSDDVQQLRYISSKVLQYVTSQGSFVQV